jgi:CheY-like chemotaxis protein
MIEIASWLKMIEHNAGKFYRSAVAYFADDAPLSVFLAHLAEDEAWHLQIIGTALEHLQREDAGAGSVTIDGVTKDKIETAFRKNSELLSAGVLTKETLIECIFATEYSEWNHIFLYVLNTLKQKRREFMYVASKMQHHLDDIGRFLETYPEGRNRVAGLRRLPPVWEKKILIVEDFDPLLELLKAVLQHEGTVETAANGLEGLRKVRDFFFDVIVSDVEMPLMDGVRFYEEAVKTDPALKNRFIFFTGSEVREHIDFFRANAVCHIKKPAPLSAIRHAVREIMQGSRVSIGD